MRIHQLSASYEAVQDRILLRINTHEGQQLQLWLTRLLLRQLFPILLGYEGKLALHSAATHNPEKIRTHSPEAQQMLADLKREEVLQRSDFATPYHAPTAQIQQEFAPFLVTQVHFSLQPGEQGQVDMTFEETLSADSASRSLQVQFTASVYIGLVALLQKTVQLAQWLDIETGFLAPPPPAGDTDMGTDLHLW